MLATNHPQIIQRIRPTGEHRMDMIDFGLKAATTNPAIGPAKLTLPLVALKDAGEPLILQNFYLINKKILFTNLRRPVLIRWHSRAFPLRPL